MCSLAEVTTACIACRQSLACARSPYQVTTARRLSLRPMQANLHANASQLHAPSPSHHMVGYTCVCEVAVYMTDCVFSSEHVLAMTCVSKRIKVRCDIYPGTQTACSADPADSVVSETCDLLQLRKAASYCFATQAPPSSKTTYDELLEHVYAYVYSNKWTARSPCCLLLLWARQAASCLQTSSKSSKQSTYLKLVTSSKAAMFRARHTAAAPQQHTVC